MRPELRAAVHAAAELLPVSSSGHLRAVGGSADVSAHAVPLVVTVVAWRSEVVAVLRSVDRRRAGMHLLAGGIPSVAGVLAGSRRKDLSLPGGLALGGVVLLAADHCAGDRHGRDAGVVDGLCLGLAQAAALWPGVSRLGTTLAVARMRGFAPAEAPLLAREVGVPVTVGALLHDLRHTPATGAATPTPGWRRLMGHGAVNLRHPRWGRLRRARWGRLRGGRWGRPRRARRGRGARAAGEPLAALAGAVAALPLARLVDRGAPLTPYAVERLALALVLLRRSRPHV